ncbi:MAG: alanine--tRNA ligase [Alphaproteobacteria bacterium]
MKTTNDIRSAFLEYFGKHDHAVMPSSPLLPHNDPTLMFANAGMNQFKNIFTGVEKPSVPRAATAQKCVRAGGKHNDLDNVGYTARHHTFFEMLGNFSFGDYFKEGAIDLAWELLTKGYGISPQRLCVTVDEKDDVAWNYWKKLTGFADHKIIRLGNNENFWAMGDTGPCGFISEIFYDHGDKVKGGPPGSPDADGDRFTEIWNLVFMQYEQVDANTRIELPKPSIDTGMGLERISAVMQGVHDNYDIDLFKALIAASQHESRNTSHASRISHRVIADHLRSSCFLIADGIMPSNEGRGYVLRRIMRRAMRHAHQLGCKEPLMYKLVPALVEEMGGQYPELKRAEATITENLRSEEERFKQTLDRGLKLFDEALADVKERQFPGDVAFKLYDTYGFPLDLTEDLLRAKGISVDQKGFDECMARQQEMARAAWSGSGEAAVGKLWFELKEKVGTTQFLGYDEDEADGKIIALVKDGQSASEAKAGDEVFILLDRTPFYGESGGQVGDSGEFFRNGESVATITDTQKPVEGLHVHKAKLHFDVKVGDTVSACITTDKRNTTRANHSATHLLHKALRDALGEHVTQKGSLVAPDKLRFDFSHPKAVTAEEQFIIEQKVNEVIAHATQVGCEEMAPDDAIAKGAMALFGEKYGDRVRVLSMGEDAGKTYSVELCGGTHVRNTGDIGLFKITSEGSVASGIRRIEAVTGEAVRQHLKAEIAKQIELLQKLIEENQALSRKMAELGEKAPAASPLSTYDIDGVDAKNLLTHYREMRQDMAEAEEKLRENNKQLSKQLGKAQKDSALAQAGDVQVETIGNIQFIGKIFDGVDGKDLRGLADEYIRKVEPGIVFVASRNEGKAAIVVAVDQFLTDMYNAVTILKNAVETVGGKGGGGKPTMAQGGGPDGDKLENALASLKKELGSEKAA